MDPKMGFCPQAKNRVFKGFFVIFGQNNVRTTFNHRISVKFGGIHAYTRYFDQKPPKNLFLGYFWSFLTYFDHKQTKIAQKRPFERFLAKITSPQRLTTEFRYNSVEYMCVHVILRKNRPKSRFLGYFLVQNPPMSILDHF